MGRLRVAGADERRARRQGDKAIITICAVRAPSRGRLGPMLRCYTQLTRCDEHATQTHRANSDVYTSHRKSRRGTVVEFTAQFGCDRLRTSTPGPPPVASQKETAPAGGAEPAASCRACAAAALRLAAGPMLAWLGEAQYEL